MILVRKILKKSWNYWVLETGRTSCSQTSVTEYSLTPRYLYKGDKIPFVAYFLETDSNANNQVCIMENFYNSLYHLLLEKLFKHDYFRTDNDKICSKGDKIHYNQLTN
jgi:hypothetical protein